MVRLIQLKHLLPYWKTIIVFLVPLLLSPMIIASDSKEARCGYVVLLMVVYWMIEAMPLAVTSLIPIALFPLLGIMSTEKVSVTYFKEANMMFFGGLVIAIAVEHCNLHKRIALRVMMICGTTPKWLMFGFMLTTMFMSMWINNTAATAMMMPIIEATIATLTRADTMVMEEGQSMEMQFEDRRMVKNESHVLLTVPEVRFVNPPQSLINERRLLRKMMMLSLAYSSNIGGTGTLTGTAPNLVLKGIVDQLYEGSTGLNFASWMVFAVPTMLLSCLAAWGLLMALYAWYSDKKCREDRSDVVKHLIHSKYTDMGPMSFHEGSVLVLFVFLVTLWMFREPQFVTGWAELFPQVKIKDATAAIFIVILLFVIPAEFNFPGLSNSNQRCVNNSTKSGRMLLEWKVVQERLPWGILLLLGGGFALAEGSKESGLSKWVGSQLTSFEVMPPYMIVFVICMIASVLTEVASNTATATILLPILANLAEAVHVHPLYLMFPATITCSFAFMLPIATPPNAIVFSSGCMEAREMIFPGLLMKLVTMLITMGTISTIGTYVFDLNTYPVWANISGTAVTLAPTVSANITQMLNLTSLA